ncbi:MAG: lipoprotein [Pseudomonadota bacterium]|nr:lipoprotein [Pseudomonadota bacterium]
MHPIRVLILLLLLASSSCGQTGPLYLPETEKLGKESLIERKTTP